MTLKEALELVPMLENGLRESDRVEGMFATTAADVIRTLVDEIEKRGKR